MIFFQAIGEEYIYVDDGVLFLSTIYIFLKQIAFIFFMSFARSFSRLIQRTTFLWVHDTLFSNFIDIQSNPREKKTVKRKEKLSFSTCSSKFLKQNEGILKNQPFSIYFSRLSLFTLFKASKFEEHYNYSCGME